MALSILINRIKRVLVVSKSGAKKEDKDEVPLGRLSKIGAHYDDNNFAYAFGFYELGNINAAIVGGGGYSEFSNNLDKTFSTPNTDFIDQSIILFSQYPDATAAIGIGSVVVAAPIIRKGAEKINIAAVNAVDIGATVAATALCGYAVIHDASFITQAACSFVIGSSLMHLSKNNPFLMKPGGLFFFAGGIGLAAFGFTEGAQYYAQPEIFQSIGDVKSTTMDKVQEIGAAALPALTCLTGIYAAQAGLLTYEGGIYETLDYREKQKKPRLNTIANKLFHPHNGYVSKAFAKALDRSVLAVNKIFKASSLLYIPKNIRDDKPFKTSMYARLPFRGLSAVAAVAAGQADLAGSFALWGGGDHATGREDNNREKRAAIEAAELEAEATDNDEILVADDNDALDKIYSSYE